MIVALNHIAITGIEIAYQNARNPLAHCIVGHLYKIILPFAEAKSIVIIYLQEADNILPQVEKEQGEN